VFLFSESSVSAIMIQDFVELLTLQSRVLEQPHQRMSLDLCRAKVVEWNRGGRRSRWGRKRSKACDV
jgi:hypothetical protein